MNLHPSQARWPDAAASGAGGCRGPGRAGAVRGGLRAAHIFIQTDYVVRIIWLITSCK